MMERRRRALVGPVGGIFLLFVPASTPNAAMASPPPLPTAYVELEGPASTTATAFQDRAVLTFTAGASRYLIIETATFAASDTYALHTSPAYTQVQAVVDDTVYSKSNQYSNLGVSGTAGQPFTTWMSFAAHQLVTFTAGSSHTIKIQYSTTNSSYAAQIRNARIVAIPVSTSQNVEQTPIETATDVNTPNCCTYGTGTTVKTLTFTPPSTEDYLVIASAQIATNPSQNGCDYLAMVRLRQGTTDEIPVDPKEEMRYQPKPVGQVYRSYANMRKYSLTGGTPQTFRIQVDARSVTCNGITRRDTFIKDTRITAIPLSAMASAAVGYAEVETEASTTSSTLQTRVTGSVTVTPSQPYVVLGMSFLKNSARSGSNGRCYQVNGHHDIGGAGAADVGYVCNSTDEYPSFFDMRQVSWPDSLSHSSFISYDTQAGGIARIKNARVLMMPVGFCSGQPDGTACQAATDGCTRTCQAGSCSGPLTPGGGSTCLSGVPREDPTAATCTDGSKPVGCRAFSCDTGLDKGYWVSAPMCAGSYPSCTNNCQASDSGTGDFTMPDNVITCNCNCDDFFSREGARYQITMQGCATPTESAPCGRLCNVGRSICGSSTTCRIGTCYTSGAAATIASDHSCKFNSASASLAPIAYGDWRMDNSTTASNAQIKVGSLTAQPSVTSGTAHMSFGASEPSVGTSAELSYLTLTASGFSLFGTTQGAGTATLMERAHGTVTSVDGTTITASFPAGSVFVGYRVNVGLSQGSPNGTPIHILRRNSDPVTVSIDQVGGTFAIHASGAEPGGQIVIDLGGPVVKKLPGESDSCDSAHLMTFVGQWPAPPPAPAIRDFADVWGDGSLAYLGHFGASHGADIVDITIPSSPLFASNFKSASGGAIACTAGGLFCNEIQDVQAQSGIAYFASNDGGGVYIVDVAVPTAPVELWQIKPTGVYAGKAHATVHNLSVDASKLYTAPGNSKPVYAYDVSSVATTMPTWVATIDTSVDDAGSNIHDITAIGGRLYTSSMGAPGRSGIYDVLALPTFTNVAHWDSGSATHSNWPTSDGSHLAVARELSGGDVKLWRLSDLSSTAIGPLPAGDAWSAHNPLISGSLLYVAWYEAGLRVYDISSPTSPALVGCFDTFSGAPKSPGFGAWGVYPFRSDGNILVSDTTGGLFVLKLPPPPPPPDGGALEPGLDGGGGADQASPEPMPEPRGSGAGCGCRVPPSSDFPALTVILILGLSIAVVARGRHRSAGAKNGVLVVAVVLGWGKVALASQDHCPLNVRKLVSNGGDPMRLGALLTKGYVQTWNGGEQWYYQCSKGLGAGAIDPSDVTFDPTGIAFASVPDVGVVRFPPDMCSSELTSFSISYFCQPRDVVAGAGVLWVSTIDGILRSDDAGGTFIAAWPQVKGYLIAQIVVTSSSAADQLVAVTYSTATKKFGLLRTLDGGKLWRGPWDVQDGEFRISSIVSSDPTRVRILEGDSTSATEIQVTDAGMVSLRALYTLTSPGYDYPALSLAASDEQGLLWLGVRGDDSAAGSSRLLESMDDGMTWSEIPGEHPHFRCLESIGSYLWSCGNNLDAARDRFAVGRSVDGGRTWQPSLVFGAVCGVVNSTCDIDMGLGCPAVCASRVPATSRCAGPVPEGTDAGPDGPSEKPKAAGSGCNCGFVSQPASGVLSLGVPMLIGMIRRGIRRRKTITRASSARCRCRCAYGPCRTVADQADRCIR